MATIAVEYGVNEEDALYLPCRDSELEEVLRAVNAGSSNEITIINVMWPEGLRMLNGLTVDADEMNFLAKRMDSFVPMELMKFIAAASVINDMDTCKLINLSFNTERYTLVQDVTDLAQIGKMRYMSIHGGILPEDQESIDFAEIGRKLLSSGTGIPTEFGLLYENKDEPFETSYNGVNFPAYYYRADFIAGVRLEYSGKSEYLYLPEEPVTIEKALKRLGCPDLVECTVIVECYGNIDDNWQSKLMGLEGNRRIGSSIIAGPFFLVGENGEDFRSLTDAETRLCMERFSKPEQISQLEVQEDMGFTMGFFN